jgi:hypothetical protein
VYTCARGWAADKMTNIDYVNKGLYETIYEGGQRRLIVRSIKNDTSSYRAYCIQCDSMSVFKAESQKVIPITAPIAGHHEIPKDDTSFYGDIDFGKRLHCAMCGMFMCVYFKVLGDKVVKVGSYPSTADLDRGRLFSECNIPKSRIPKELATAIGLKAHGAYIGAYAYLRRVYETLIENARKKAEQDGVLAENFERIHIKEKIKALSDYLPEYMVENRNAYGILSKGIHELSEDDCKIGYEILYNLIVLILEDQEERRKKELRKKDISNAINALNGKFSD